MTDVPENHSSMALNGAFNAKNSIQAPLKMLHRRPQTIGESEPTKAVTFDPNKILMTASRV
jgi:hypothetical protein